MSDQPAQTGGEPQLGGAQRETPPEASGLEPGMGGDRAVDYLIEGLQSPDLVIYQQTLLQLAKRNHPQAIDGLMNILFWDGPPLAQFSWRVLAANALARMDHDRAFDALLDALHHRNWGIQMAATGALGLSENSRAVGPLIEIMHGRDKQLGRIAAQSLERIGTPEALEAVAAWKDGD